MTQWNRLWQNGNLIHTDPRHREHLDRFYDKFGKDNRDLFKEKYPEFLKEKEEIKKEETTKNKIEITETSVEEVVYAMPIDVVNNRLEKLKIKLHPKTGEKKRREALISAISQ